MKIFYQIFQFEKKYNLWAAKFLFVLVSTCYVDVNNGVLYNNSWHIVS